MNTQSLEGAMMNNPEQQQEKRLKPIPEQSLKCPRCDSTNTKFCYYNNYSLSQPRYFCKGCRRYWTQGGSLRKVPVGGGCRRNKRSSSSSPASSSSSPASSSINSSKRVLQDDTHLLTTSCPQMVLLPSLPTPSMLTNYSFQTNHDPSVLANPNPHGFLDILRSGFLENSSSGGLQSFYHGFGLDDKQLIIPNTEVSSCCKKSVDVDRQISGLDGNLGLDSERDFWGGVGFGSIGGSSSSSSIWQGLVNSSLM